MSSPGSDGSQTNSFEDAENGNSKDGKTEAQADQEKPAEQGDAQGEIGSAGAGITLSEDDILFLTKGGSSKSDDTQAKPAETPNPLPLLPPPPRVTRNTDDQGIGASSAEGQREPSSVARPRPSPTRRVSTGQVSPTSPEATAQSHRGRSRSFYEDKSPNISPTKEAASPPKTGSGASRHDQREPEPIMAVGVASVDIDTASLANTGDTQNLGIDPARDADVSWANTICCWLCRRYQICRRCCDCARCPKVYSPARTVFAITALIVAVAVLCVTHFVVSPYVDHRIKDALVLRPGMDNWKHPRANIVADVYLFNISNPEQFMDNGQIPVLTEVGPYSFSVGVEKINISWNDNGTVSYREHYTFTFDESTSSGSQDDQITTANFPLLILDDYMGPSSVLLNRLLSKRASRLVESHTIRELIWGYHSSVFQEIKEMANWAPFRYFHLAEEIPTTMAALPKDNSSVSRMFNVYTGADNFSRLNDIYSWDYNRKLPYWTTEEANEIKGTDGSIFKPFMNEKSQVTFFFAQLFRSFQLEFKQTRKQNGLHTLRYIIPDSQFFNSTIPSEATAARNPSPTRSSKPDVRSTTKPSFRQIFSDHEDGQKGGRSEIDKVPGVGSNGRIGKTKGHKSGYCVPECVPNGVYSIEPCTDAPLYISLPHFLGADPFYLSQVTGLRPQEDKHRPLFDIDSLTGVVVSTSRRYQLNVRVNAGRNGDTFLPVLWVDMRAKIDDETVSHLKLASHAKLGITIAIFFTMGLIAMLFIVTLCLIIYSCCVGTERSRYRPLMSRADRLLL
ncbi:scavenger receptor class B member 2 [Elysia marginata]|uniref:Scavenger receptor class B member 1 n=1 Tax=Elysia marginata TaxID=1093978 RepID=A0AAV4EMZ2_9GAST|nr:scavenger receptor class B member 2 [Elysia marginata]